VIADPAIWRGRSVLLTGHTGFKGGWLAVWLHTLGARVHGYALNPPTEPSFFDTAGVRQALTSDARADLADRSALQTAFDDSRPEIVFHLAAQPLVRESYRDPLGTLATNVIGTANVLEAVRGSKTVRAVVVITTDKIYENLETGHAYRETDALGGHDPYSASKAAAEIVSSSYRASFLTGAGIRMATARAGNVIGGGDWAAERLVPDCLRAFAQQLPVRLRRPAAVRPWQHVLEPLAGYLQLAEKLAGNEGPGYAKAWNFGPDVTDDATVGQVAELIAMLWGGGAEVVHEPSDENPHEAGLLRLDSSCARRELGWRPRWSLQQALERTVAWHRAWVKGADLHDLSLAQIREYGAGARA
jgi:CDP-glucose 4,6-dehydratase